MPITSITPVIKFISYSKLVTFKHSDSKNTVSWTLLSLPIIKEVPELNIYFLDLRDNELREKRYAWAIISTIKPDLVKSLLSEARNRWSINNIEKV